jgi:hypothetical protein
MKRIVKLTESSINQMVKKILKESYDSEKLYSKDYIVNQLKNSPYSLKNYVKNLPSIPCFDKEGNQRVCTKIPEVVYVYLTGRY